MNNALTSRMALQGEHIIIRARTAITRVGGGKMQFVKWILVGATFSLPAQAAPTWRLAAKEADGTAVYVDTASIAKVASKTGLRATNADLRFDLTAPDGGTGAIRIEISYQFFCDVQQYKMLKQDFYAADGRLISEDRSEIEADALKGGSTLYKAAYDVCWNAGESKGWAIPR